MTSISTELPASGTPDAKSPVPSPLKALFSNLPEILMIGITIWVADAAAIISFIGILHAGIILAVALALIFAAPALWASWQTLKLAAFPPMSDNTTDY